MDKDRIVAGLDVHKDCGFFYSCTLMQNPIAAVRPAFLKGMI